MKQHGIGIGYRYPPDFEGSDVGQQYLPDDLRDRRYYHPADHGYEATLASRMQTRRDARAAGSRSATPPPGQAGAHPPGDIMGTRESNRRRLADTEKRDAAD